MLTLPPCAAVAVAKLNTAERQVFAVLRAAPDALSETSIMFRLVRVDTPRWTREATASENALVLGMALRTLGKKLVGSGIALHGSSSSGWLVAPALVRPRGAAPSSSPAAPPTEPGSQACIRPGSGRWAEVRAARAGSGWAGPDGPVS